MLPKCYRIRNFQKIELMFWYNVKSSKFPEYNGLFIRFKCASFQSYPSNKISFDCKKTIFLEIKWAKEFIKTFWSTNNRDKSISTAVDGSDFINLARKRWERILFRGNSAPLCTIHTAKITLHLSKSLVPTFYVEIMAILTSLLTRIFARSGFQLTCRWPTCEMHRKYQTPKISVVVL